MLKMTEGVVLASGSQPKAILPSKGFRPYLEVYLLVTLGWRRRVSYWHVVGRDQECC